MNPAPPVIMMFLTSGSGSNFVLPFKIGASFHTPKSSKNLWDPLLVAGDSLLAINWNSHTVELCGRQNAKLTGRGSVDSIFGGHARQLLMRARRCTKFPIQSFLCLLNSGGGALTDLRGGTLQKEAVKRQAARGRLYVQILDD